MSKQVVNVDDCTLVGWIVTEHCKMFYTQNADLSKSRVLFSESFYITVKSYFFMQVDYHMAPLDMKFQSLLSREVQNPCKIFGHFKICQLISETQRDKRAAKICTLSFTVQKLMVALHFIIRFLCRERVSQLTVKIILKIK